jgi:hypothetical protein
VNDPEKTPELPVIGDTTADAASNAAIPAEVFGYKVLVRIYLNLS